jgi:hypothetical protein
MAYYTDCVFYGSSTTSCTATTGWFPISGTTNWFSGNVTYTLQVTAAEPTPEQIVAIAQAEREYQEQVVRQTKEREEANVKAEALLLEHLNQAQRVMYEQAQKIIVEGGESKKKYEIKKGWAGNVRELDDAGRAVKQLCIHPSLPIPHCDNMLTQKLMIENCESDFLRTANATPIGR